MTKDTSIEIPRERKASGILVFVIADIIVFGLLFGGFMDDRSRETAPFNASAASLDSTLGMWNTIVLVTSGLMMVLAVNAAHALRIRQAQIYIIAAVAIGLVFGVNKVIEYHAKIDAGITMLSNNFYMFYYALTGAHCLHFLGGIAALSYLLFISRSDSQAAQFRELIGPTAFYWHMVDLLWIFIYPLLYLLK